MSLHVTLVSLAPPSTAADRPALSPELLAATGARYSRSNDGLGAILSQIDPGDPDASVERIFKFVDYGHASIADMAPVALFLDGVSMWLAYELFRVSPTAGGQESSTRYIRLSEDGLVSGATLGIDDTDAWRTRMGDAFSAYRTALSFWEEAALTFPERVRIPAATPPKAAARMRRNYAFDRARYFLPVATATNVCLVQSARAWVSLCQHLLSHPLPEANSCGAAIASELARATPRLLKHAKRVDTLAVGLSREWSETSSRAQTPPVSGENAPTARLEIFAPAGVDGKTLRADLSSRDNRYGWVGDGLRRTAVRFAWDAVAFAELRDLNRHRTGTKFCPLAPVGFYHAADELPEPSEAYETLGAVGDRANREASQRLAGGSPTGIYETLLGTQFSFEHTTTADKFLYEAELRTGLGAHYRYARHLRETLSLWYERYPETRDAIFEGQAEPE